MQRCLPFPYLLIPFPLKLLNFTANALCLFLDVPLVSDTEVRLSGVQLEVPKLLFWMLSDVGNGGMLPSLFIAIFIQSRCLQLPLYPSRWWVRMPCNRLYLRTNVDAAISYSPCWGNLNSRSESSDQRAHDCFALSFACHVPSPIFATTWANKHLVGRPSLGIFTWLLTRNF